MTVIAILLVFFFSGRKSKSTQTIILPDPPAQEQAPDEEQPEASLAELTRENVQSVLKKSVARPSSYHQSMQIVITSGDISVTDSKLSADGGEHGISGRNVSIDNSTVKASANMHDATALMAYGGDVRIRNGSNVSLLGEGVYAYGIRTTNFDENGPGGSVFIESSSVEAIARYAADLPPIDGGDIILRGSPDDSERTSGHVYGILAHTNKGLSPAVINIVNSNVTAAGDDGAIFAAAVTTDGSQAGTIVIASGDIVTPVGGVVRDVHIASKPDNPTVTKGQLIASPGDPLDDVNSDEIAKHAVIAPNDDPGGMGSGGEGSKHNAVFKKDGAKIKPASAKITRASDTLAATGDGAAAGIIAAAIAGTAAIGAGVLILLYLAVRYGL